MDYRDNPPSEGPLFEAHMGPDRRAIDCLEGPTPCPSRDGSPGRILLHLPTSESDAVDGSSTGTQVPRTWLLLR